MESKIKTIDQITIISQELKEKGKKIVTCNGCFDILHIGHIKFLEEAKAQGDILIVGLNSDASVKGNKGKDRPINTQDNRAKVLAALGTVDYVVIFDDKDPINLLKKIKPDVHCNGEEYGEDCIESEVLRQLNARLHLIKNYGGFSTTKTIKNMQK